MKKDNGYNAGDEGDLIKVRHKKEKPLKAKKVRPKYAPDNPSSRKNAKAPRARVRFDLPGGEPETNSYFLAVADRYRWARYLSFIIMVAFLTVMLIFFRESITYDNLMYLAKDLDADTAVSVGTYTNISYDEQYAVSFGLFRQRIAVAGTSGFSLYSSTGSRELDYECGYTQPQLVCGEKYALMYDAGGTGYSLYTTIARVANSEADEVIEDGAVGGDGSFALCTRSEDSKFLVTVYNSDFKAKTKYYKDTYVMDIALDADGKNLAIVSAGVNSSSVSAEVMFCKVGTEEKSSVALEGTMPLAVRYADDGSLILLSDTGLYIYRDGAESARYLFEGKNPGAFDICGKVICVSLPENAIGSENTVLVFDTGLNLLYNIQVSEKIERVCTDGTANAYAVCEDSIVNIKLSDGATDGESIDFTVLDALAVPGCLILCEPDGTTAMFAD